MVGCCEGTGCELEVLRGRQASTLRVVLAINAILFVVELVVGLMAGSVSLVADSLDMLGDALVYGFSLYVVARGARMKAVAALMKGGIMALFGFLVLAQAGYKIVVPSVPASGMIGFMGAGALAANGLCLALLWRHREDDINMSSVWLCSRNDIIANVSVILVAFTVGITGSGWPDIAVGLALGALFCRSALFVVRGATEQLWIAPGAPSVPDAGPQGLAKQAEFRD